MSSTYSSSGTGTGTYTGRHSYIGNSSLRADPVLSSFSPVGSSKLREEIKGTPSGTDGSSSSSSVKTLSHNPTPYQQRTSTSSSYDRRRSVVLPPPSSEVDVISRDSSSDYNSYKREPFVVTSSKTEESKSNNVETLGRLSISGRLSVPASQIPETPIFRRTPATSSIIEHQSTTNVSRDEKERYASSAVSTENNLRDRFSIKAVEKPILESSISSNYTSTLNRGNETMTAVPDMIKNLVEKSINEAMSEIRNDIQNLHVDLLKQTLAQQNMLRQIISTMPEAFKKLADDYKSLQDENERLRAKLNHY